MKPIGQHIEKFKDKLLSLRNKFLFFVLKRKYGNDTSTILYGHFLDYEDNFTSMSQKEFYDKYKSSPDWGVYHPNDLQQWYDPAGITHDSEGVKFHITKNTKVVTSYVVDGSTKPQENLIPVTIPYGVGLCVSKKAFKYGVFEWCIKLPKGAALWPAVWLSCRDSWPPEIDVIEAYSDEKGNYGQELQSNIHFGSNGDNHTQTGPIEHGYLIDKDEYFIMHLHWEKDFIKIYYNGFLVRKITNKKNLEWFKDVYMLNIMNAAIRKAIMGKTTYENMAQEPMIVRYFRYYKR